MQIKKKKVFQEVVKEVEDGGGAESPFPIS